MNARERQAGFSLVELLISSALAALLLGGLSQWLRTGLAAMDVTREQSELAREARFAMERIVAAIESTDLLLLPLADNPGTNFPENLRVQTVPPSPPQGSSTLATAVLAVTLDRTQDLDGDGVFDADNDGDGLFDEDLGDDVTNDGEAGLAGIDDNGDGSIETRTAFSHNDDEDTSAAVYEDPIDGVDNDGDGSIDEDPGPDMNNDSKPGIAGVDDDGDGTTDEGNREDDDEDGLVNEDWLDAVAFYLDGRSLIERRPVPWDENGDGSVTGADVVETVLTANVTLLSVQRIAPAAGQHQLVAVTLGLTGGDGQGLEVTITMRLGRAL